MSAARRTPKIDLTLLLRVDMLGCRIRAVQNAPGRLRLLGLLLSLPFGAFAETLVLQLKWEHEFQFAGYYAAQREGYYRDAGLDVEIRSAFDAAGHYRDARQALIDGEVDFAIGGADILSGRDAGHPLVVLAPIFQKSPGALVTMADRKLRSLRDLAGLRVAVNPTDYITDEFRTLLGTRLTRHAVPQLVAEPLSLDTLRAGRADALLTYTVSAQQAAAESATPIQLLPIADAEQMFYGDTLYTHQRVIERDPEMVKRFLEASLRGWRYALTHRDEVLAAMSELPRHSLHYTDLDGYNQRFARRVDEYLFYPHLPIGLNDPERWRDMHTLMKSAGLVQGDFAGSALFFDVGAKHTSGQERGLALVLGLACIALVLLLVYTLPAQWLAPLLLSVLLLVLTFELERHLHERYRESLRQDVWNDLVGVRLKLEAAINRNFALLRGVAGLIASKPDIDQREFAEFAATLIDLEPLLINIAAAPDMVIRYVYPEPGNESVIGMDYRKVTEQWPMAALARDSRRTVIAGPLDLVQGGRGIIGRTPVFIQRGADSAEQFWGIVSAPMDFDGLLDDIGLAVPRADLRLAMRHGRLSASLQGERVFFGDAAVFDANPVTLPVSLGTVEWELAAVPAAGWASYPPALNWFKLVGLLLALILPLGLHVAIRQFQSRIRIFERLRRNEAILSRVGRIANVGGWEIDLKTGREYASDELYHLHGLVPVGIAEEGQRRWLNYYDDINRALIEQRIESAIAGGEAQSFELMVNAGEADEAWLRHTLEPVVEDGQLSRIVGVVQDISVIRRADATIEKQANTDAVTGLPNRNLFSDRLHQALQLARRHRRQLAVLFIDLDHFKDINDSLGHGVGDLMLATMGQRFRTALRVSDTVARLGGDEFTVLLDGIHGSQYCADVAQKLLDIAQQPVTVGDHQVFTAASIGVTLYPEDGQDVETLLQRADQAMYAAKSSGRNTVRFFTRSMQDEADRRHQLHGMLVNALKDQTLEVHYQPILDTRTHEVVKCEALLRWFHPTLGAVEPTEFVALAEDTGLIGELGEYVMLKACADIEALNQRMGTHIALAFNKSTREFLEESRVHVSALDRLQRQALFPNITIEITENLLMHESADIVGQLHALREAGVEIAIDDFGTGYSSLSYLRRFPVDIIKIDKSFIQEIETDDESCALVRAIVAMAHGLRIDVVAEGVETEGQLNILGAMECRYVQGFYFSPGLPLEELCDYLRAHQPQPESILVDEEEVAFTMSGQRS